MLEYRGSNMAMYLKYVLIYVLQLILLDREMKIREVSDLSLCQNNIFLMLRILEPCIYFKYSYNSLIDK